MNGIWKVFRTVSVGALFALGGASLARADVTSLDEMATENTPLRAAFTIGAWPSSSEMRGGGTLSNCISVYQGALGAIVFHSVCQSTNTNDSQEDLLAESRHDHAAIALGTPLSTVFTRDLDAGTSHAEAGPRPGTFVTRWHSNDESEAIDLGDEDMDHHSGESGDKRHRPHKDKDKDKHHDGGDDLVPEPSTLVSLGTAIFILGALLRRRLATAA